MERLRERIDGDKVGDPLEKLRQRYERKSINFTFKKITVRDVKAIIKRMKKSSSSGVDGISSEHMKLVTDEIAPAVADLINGSLMEGKFPECFKLAKIICIYLQEQRK